MNTKTKYFLAFDETSVSIFPAYSPREVPLIDATSLEDAVERGEKAYNQLFKSETTNRSRILAVHWLEEKKR